MTKEEVIRNYQIPADIPDEYERWGLCGSVKQVMGHWQYDEQDIARLSLIMMLHDIGLSAQEVESYMRLTLSQTDTAQQRMNLLNTLRKRMLDEIHLREKQLERLDYLRHKLRSLGAKG